MVKNVEIDKTTYKLKDINTNNETSIKTSILIADTYNDNMNHYKEWEIFDNGSFNKTAHYTIDINGKIFEHFSPHKISNYLKNEDLNESIKILIENMGWLEKKDNIFLTWKDTIYKGEVFEQKWRNKEYWCKYNNSQINSIIFLINKLKIDFNIPLTIKSNGFLDKNIKSFKGVYYKSNISKTYKDINPSWDFKKIKKI